MRIAHSPVPTPIPAPSLIEPIEACYLSRRMFLEHAKVGADSCRFFVRCTPRIPTGTSVLTRLRFHGEAGVYEIAGRVAQSREDLRGAARSGLLIEVRGPGLFEFARAYAVARGNPPELGRRGQDRVKVELPAKVEFGGQKLALRVRDLSRGGAFLEAPEVRNAEGAVVRISIKLGLFKRLNASARVVWLGRRFGTRGFGVEFLELAERDRTRLLELVRDT